VTTSTSDQPIGRRSLSGRGSSPRLNIRTTPALAERLRARAEREGKSVSDLVREALEQYVEHGRTPAA